jgi:pSer/pThr/pTyr-binding forkhead associated (FHA) protein
MKYIHLECLRQWLSNRVFKHIGNNEKCNIYLFKQPECELCKTKFPDIIKHNGSTYVILDFNNNFENYIIVESLTLDKKQNKYIYIVNMDNPKNIITIGRGSESSIFINDISVSRLHCFFNINKKAKKLFLVDNNSKFGTLVLIQAKEITLGLDIKLHVQIGRSYLEFVSKISSNFFECCGVKEKNNSDYYYLQNKDKIIFNKTLIIRSDNIKQEIDMPKVEEIKVNNNEIDSNNKTSVNENNKDEIEINENEIKKSNNDENHQ